MRLFFAIELPEELRSALASFSASLAGDLRRVRADQLHLTLRFVGEVDDPAALVQAVALDGPPFSLRVEGGGTFGRDRVLWAGVGGEVERAAALAAAIERAVVGLGHPAADQRFSPHITLARAKGRVPRESVERLRFLLPLPRIGEFTVSEVVLFRSELLPAGARHTAIHRFPLASPPHRG
jgi:RNA 2',3'-cyclic 3'-phosphodiesterase